MQRIRAEPGIIVDLRYAGLIRADPGKLAGDDLSAEALASLIDSNLACVADLRGQVPSRKKPTRPTADHSDPKFPLAALDMGLNFYVAFVAQGKPPQPRPGGRLSRCGPREHLPSLSCNPIVAWSDFPAV